MTPFRLLTSLLWCFRISVASNSTDAGLPVGDIEFLVTNKSDIHRMRETGEKYLYKTNAMAIGDVDYHLEKNLLFWIDTGKHQVHSQALNANSTSPSVIFKQDNWEPIALAVDCIADKVYVVDIKGIKVDLFSVDGKYHSILIGTDLVRPSDIELDPYNRLLFILDGFRIIRARMDGTETVAIVKQNINAASGISVDVVSKKIYWVHRNQSKVIESNYFGQEIRSHEVNTSFPGWSKFVVVNESIFWAGELVDYRADCSDERIYAFSSLRTSVGMRPVHETNPVPTIKVLRFSGQSSASDSCKSDNGGCQHMCVLVSQYSDPGKPSRRCVCNVGWRLDTDLKSCAKVGDFLMYTQPGVLKSHLTENFASSNEPYLPIAEDRSKFIDFDYQYRGNHVYYIVKKAVKNDIVYRVHPNLHEPTVFLEGTRDTYQSLAIDWMLNHLYYTDPQAGVVKVMGTEGERKSLAVLENLEEPEDISVHPRRGLIFFLQTNGSTKVTVLSRAHTDGTNLTTLDATPLRKRCGFAVDNYDDRLYWYEWRRGHIHHMDLDFADAQIVQSPFTKFVYTISIYEKWIYVATTISEGVYRMDKRTGQQAEFVLSDLSNRIIRMKAFGAGVQKVNGDHPCLVVANGGCSQFCFGVPRSSGNGSLVKACAG